VGFKNMEQAEYKQRADEWSSKMQPNAITCRCNSSRHIFNIRRISLRTFDVRTFIGNPTPPLWCAFDIGHDIQGLQKPADTSAVRATDIRPASIWTWNNQSSPTIASTAAVRLCVIKDFVARRNPKAREKRKAAVTTAIIFLPDASQHMDLEQTKYYHSPQFFANDTSLCNQSGLPNAEILKTRGNL